MSNKNLFLQSPDAGDIQDVFAQGAAALQAAPVYSQGIGPRQAPQQQAAQPSAGFEAAVSKVLGHEGGYTPSDGNTGAPANYGINQKHNPDLDVKNITQADAVQRYKTNYWDAIGGDSLPAEIQATALDAAVNQGPARANRWLKQSGGDVQKFNQLRREHYEALAATPQYSRFRNTWMKRLDSYDQQAPKSVANQGGTPQNLQQQLDQEEQGRYQVLTEQEAQAMQRKQLQSTLDAEEAGRFQVLTEDELTKLPASASMPEGIAPKQEGSFLGDIGRMALGGINKGVGQAVGGIGEAARIVGEYTTTPLINAVFGTNLRTGNALKPIADFYKQAGEGAQAGVSQESAQAIKESTPDGDLFKPSTWTFGTNPTARGVLMLTTDVLGSMAPVIAASIASGGSAAVGAAVGAAQSGGAAADQARQTIQEMAKAGTLGAESAYYRDLIAQGKSPEEAAAITADAAANLATPMAAVIGGLGGAATSKIVNPATSIMGAAPLAGRVAGRAGVGAVEEGAQEVAEGVAGRAGTNLGAGTNVDLTEGSFGDAVLGAMGGGSVGGAAGALSSRTAPQEQPQPVARQEPAIDVTYQDEQGNTVTEVVPAEKPSGPITRAIEKLAPKQTIITDDDGKRHILDTGTGEMTLVPEDVPAAPTEQAVEQVVAPEGNAPSMDEFDAQFADQPAIENEASNAQQEPIAAEKQPETQAEQAQAAPEEEANAGGENTKNAPQAVENKENDAGPEKPLTEWAEPELRERLKYVAQQAKTNGGWDGRLLKERARVSKEINRRNSEIRNDQNPASNAVPNANVAPASDQAAAPMPSDQPARSAPAEVDDVRANGGQGAARATELPVGEGVSGTDAAAKPDAALIEGGSSLDRDSSWVVLNRQTGEVIMETFDKAKVDALNTDKYEAFAAQDYLGGMNRATKAAGGKQASGDQLLSSVREVAAERASRKQESDAFAGRWFGSEEKANAYVAKQGAQDTHEVVKTGKVRFEVKPKTVQEADAPEAKAKPLTRDQVEGEVTRQLNDQWGAQTGEGFTIGKHYPATVRVNGKERKLGLFKKKGGGVLYAEALDQTIYGPSFTQYKVTADGKLEEVGTRNLFGLDKAVAEQAIAEFNAMHEQALPEAVPAQSADADLDAMFDDAVAAKKQGEAKPEAAAPAPKAKKAAKTADKKAAPAKNETAKIERDPKNGYAKVKIGRAQHFVTPYDDHFVIRDKAGEVVRGADRRAMRFPTEADAISYAEAPAKTEAAKASESLTSAAKNTAAGLTSAIDGLGELFGGAGKVNSGLSFDEETYAKAKPLFQQAIAQLGDAGRDLKAAMQAIVNMVMDKFGEEATQRMKPYVVRFVKDMRDGATEKEAADAANTGGTTEKRAPLKQRAAALQKQFAKAKDGQMALSVEASTVVDGSEGVRYFAVDGDGNKVGLTQITRASLSDEALQGMMERFAQDVAVQHARMNKPKTPESEIARAPKGMRFSVADEGVTAAKDAKTGQPLRAYFARNTVSSKANDAAFGDVGRAIEPAGEYMSIDSVDLATSPRDGWEYGSIEFSNPLVLEHKDTTSQGWKKDLSEMFAGKTGKALSNAVRKAGHDAIVTRDKYGYSEVVNLDGKKGAAPKPAEEGKNLIVAHNLSADNLLHANELGGLAVPSLAITNVDAPLDGFGEITLIGDTGLATPGAKNPIFDADVYSPRFPSVKVKVNEAAVKKVLKPLQDAAQELGVSARGVDGAIDEMERGKLGDAVSRVTYDTGMRLGYATSVLGKKIDIPREAPKPVAKAGAPLIEQSPLKEALAGKTQADIKGLSPVESQELARKVYVALVNKMVAEDSASESPKGFDDTMKLVNRRIGIWADHQIPSGSIDLDDGLIGMLTHKGEMALRNLMANAAAPARAEEASGDAPVDVVALGRLLDKEVPREQMDGWVREKLAPAMGEKRIVKDNGTTGAYTMANIVREMTRKVRDAEGFNYGLGNARSKGATKFKKLAQIQAQRDRIVSNEQFEAARKEIDGEFNRLSDAVEPHKVYEREWTSELLAEAIGESYAKPVARALEDAGLKGVPEALQKEITEFAAALAGAPTEYFEAKPQRSVGVDEFKGAVIPSNLSPEARAVLEQSGLTLREYDRSDKQGRAKAVRALADELDAKSGNVRFSTDGSDFGPVSTDHRSDPKGAIEWLKKGKTGEAIIDHPTLGEVSLVWGDGSMGLSHIARRHGERMLDRIPALLKERDTYTKATQNARVFLGNETDEAAIRLDWNGKDKVWLVSAYEKHGDAPKASAQAAPRNANRLTEPDLRSEITSGALGKVVDQLIESGEVVLHKSDKTLPKEARGVRGVQAVTMPDNKIHMVAGNIARGNAQAVLLHEMFHRGGEGVLGQKEWGNLQGRLGSLYRQSQSSDGKMNAFYKKASERVRQGRAQGAISTAMTVEEFGAYAIEEYSKNRDSLPAVIRKWVEDVIGFAKAYMLSRYGKQMGELTPAQLAGIAKLAVLNKAVTAAKEGRFSADGGQTNTDAFRKWFGDSRVVDSDGKPLVVYHGTAADIAFFDPLALGASTNARSARGGFFFSSSPKVASGYAMLSETRAGLRAAVLNNAAKSDVLPSELQQFLKEEAQKVKEKGLGDAMWIDSPGGGGFSDANVMPLYLSIQNPLVVDYRGREYREHSFADMVKKARQNGHDGVIFRSAEDSAHKDYSEISDIYVAFEPEQIKSATGNNGDFDPANPDIRYSVADEEVDAKTGATGNEPPPEGVLDTFKPADPSRFDNFQAKFQNNMNRVRKVQERIKALTGVSNLGRADYYGAETNRPGRVAARLEDAKELMFKPMLKKLAKTEYKPADLESLLHAQHAHERNAAIARINPDMADGGSGMTNAEADAILEKYKDAKELHALADDARAMASETLDLKRAYGLVTAEDYEALQNAYESYVPLKGDGEYGPKVKRAMGHDAREEYILENIARDYEQAIMVGEKNLARQSLLALVAENPDENLWTLGMPPRGRYVAGQVYTIKDSTLSAKNGGDVVAQFTSQSQVNAFLEAKGPKAGQFVVEDSNGDRVATFVKPLQDNEVMVYVDGRPVRIQVFDEHLAQQLRPLDQAQMGVLLEGARKVNRYLSSIYTGYNPYFILKNAVRDMITGTINMTGNQGAKVAAKAWTKYGPANKAIAKWAATGKYPEGKYGAALREYREQGGKTGASYMSDLEAHTRNLERLYEDAYGAKKLAKDGRPVRASWVAARKAVMGLAHTIEIANQATENALRLSLYMALREQGESAGKAAQAAKTVTVDFDRKGAMTGTMGAMYIFFNPAVQGTANAFNTLARGKHKKQAWAALGAMATLGLFAATQGMDDDEDRWQGLGWDKRTKNFIITAGNHTLTIPLSQEFAPAYALGAAIGEAMRGESAMKSTMRLLSSFIDAYVPFNGIYSPDSKEPLADVSMAMTPTALRPLLEVAFNRNVFGSQIVPESQFNESAPDNTKMNRTTKGTPFDSTAQMIAGLGVAAGANRYEDSITKISPETLKYLWSTYTGGLGRFVTDTVGITRLTATAPDTVSSSEVPFLKDFWQEHDVKPLRSRFYDLAGESKDVQSQKKLAEKAGDDEALAKLENDPEAAHMLSMSKVFAGSARQVRAIREEQLEVSLDEKVSVADKRRKLKELEAQEEAIYREAFEQYKAK